VSSSTPTYRARTRWLRFNLVGALGFLLQTLALWLLVRGAGLSAGVAITIAVLTAVSHNFVWHERCTWPNLPREKRFDRWLAFHVSTGMVSVLTNLGITLTETVLAFVIRCSAAVRACSKPGSAAVAASRAARFCL